VSGVQLALFDAAVDDGAKPVEPPTRTATSALRESRRPRVEGVRAATAGQDAERTEAVVVHAEPGISEDTQHAAARLTDHLSARLRRPVRLVVTDNRRTMLSAREKGPHLEVRLHHMFLAAQAPVQHALARYLRSRDRAAGRILDAFIEENRDAIAARKKRRQILRTRGANHDLRTIFDALEASHFQGTMTGVRITWGRRTRRRKGQRSIQLGTYVPAEELIRVHPVLDQEWVPRFYVESVVFHEMLHHAMPPKREGGRMRFHTPAFRAAERAFVHHDRAERWESANLRRLLRSLG